MKISVITLTYNSIDTIKETIKSIKSQTYKNIEKIWIDNKSNDGTLEFLKKNKDNKTILISEKDKGIVDAFNKGAKIATGKVIGFLHSDDKFYDKDTIKDIAEKFKNSKINLVYGDLNYVTKNNKIIRKWHADNTTNQKIINNKNRIIKKLKFGWMPPHPTVYIKKKFYDKVGNYNKKYRISFDYDHLIRIFLKKELQCCYIPKILINMSPGGNSNKLKNIINKMIEDYKIIKKNNIGNLLTLIMKNIRKIPQINLHYYK
jgi:glycosyltransferase